MVYVPALSRDVYLIPYLEVYRPAVLISLGPLFLLSLLNPVIGDFLCAILGELFIDAYRFVYYRPRLVKVRIGYIT
jgi:hypothetical protein